ncbi:MAG TPA: flagellar biosynthesis anti-sigma factor FlgM [Terracidiphilus sp.]|jgi:anti-sigma28 factor (negative regulator of flagellin synthesis)|nr:flagellar biosynthesis anti-sigma factor FlgM [Terracidiphilus sp.]
MDVRNSLEGLKSLLGVNPPAPAATGPKSGTAAGTSALGSDRATLSNAGSEVLLTAGEDGVRMEKVSAVQAALAAGTYDVPSSAVASKVVDSMLGGEK